MICALSFAVVAAVAMLAVCAVQDLRNRRALAAIDRAAFLDELKKKDRP